MKENQKKLLSHIEELTTENNRLSELLNERIIIEATTCGTQTEDNDNNQLEGIESIECETETDDKDDNQREEIETKTDVDNQADLPIDSVNVINNPSDQNVPNTSSIQQADVIAQPTKKKRKTCHGRTLICEICGYNANNKLWRYNKHMQTHDKSKVIADTKCPVCEKVDSYEKILDHLRHYAAKNRIQYINKKHDRPLEQRTKDWKDFAALKKKK